MASFLDTLIGAIVPKEIYDPSSGRILGGIFGGGGQPTGAVNPEPTQPRSEMIAPFRWDSYQAAAALGLPTGTGPGLTRYVPSERSFVADYASAIIPTGGAFGDIRGAAMSLMPGGVLSTGLARIAIPAIERVVAKTVLVVGGVALAESIYKLYISLRGSGHNHKRARRLAHQAHGIHFKRRRMRPTNIHALRRAMRRVRGARRVLRKVHGLMPARAARGGWGGGHRRRRVYRRGDVDPWMVEDYLDAEDEYEDLGDGEESFRGAAVAGE